MAKLKLNPDPTFTATVPVPIPGGDPAPVVFTFKHRDRKAIEAFLKSAHEREDAANILEMASGWDLADAFTRENVEVFVANYIGGTRAVFDVYLEELTKARAKN